MPHVSATYRLQFREGFGLRDAARIVPYLDRLGISHVYASPLTTARSGSTHGYDVCRYDAIDPALGGEAAFDDLVSVLTSRGMGLILDFVPNHMAASVENPWWRSVLEHGRGSPHAGWFDIDWEARTGGTPGKVLLPVLGGPYGEVLEAGELSLAFDGETGEYQVRYYESAFPVAPGSPERIADEGQPPEVVAAQVSGDHGRLHALLEAQHYRLAHWRMGAFAINYRRFFEIDELAGLRVERDDVFDAVHGFILDRIAEGMIDGLRIDHVDGLRDPKGYLDRLAEAVRDASKRDDFPVYVEKILASEEELRGDWPVTGTTGYDVLPLLAGVLADPAAEDALTGTYEALTGDEGDYRLVATAARKFAVRRMFPGERDSLASRASALAAENPYNRDASVGAFREALDALLVSFPVYRSYVRRPPAEGADRPLLQGVFAKAEGICPAEARPALEVLRRLVLDTCADAGPEEQDFVARLQQLTGPVTAKSIEDTAFYRYQRLVVLNEVGGEPDRLSVTPKGFHRAMARRVDRWPNGLVATTTHDTKFGEDVRARLLVLSQLPDDWHRQARRWLEALAPSVTRLPDGPAPEPAMVYRILQVVLGAWPATLSQDDAEGLADLRDRVRAAIGKTVREAKLRTAWTDSNDRYEKAVAGFIDGFLNSNQPLLAEIVMFASALTRAGAVNGLSQLLMKLAVPGVPDIYQGSELWELSLVDPDNRRPVDFALRDRLLDAFLAAEAERLTGDWQTGAIKLVLLNRVLRFRRSNPLLFAQGSYQPLDVVGPCADDVLAFARRWQGECVAVFVPRLTTDSLDERDSIAPDPRTWANTEVLLPKELRGRRWTFVSEPKQTMSASEALPLARIFERLPVAMLHSWQ